MEAGMSGKRRIEEVNSLFSPVEGMERFRKCVFRQAEGTEQHGRVTGKLGGGTVEVENEVEAEIMAWNCQGVGSSLTIHPLKETCRLQQPDIVVLFETKNKDGGIIVMWHREEDVRIVQWDEWFVQVELSENGQRQWRCVFVYASCEDGVRKTQLEVLKSLKEGVRGSWCVIGDFNDILEVEEKQGGNERTEAKVIQDKLKETYESEFFEREGVISVESELDEPWAEDENFWSQRAKFEHLKESDKNKKFFHTLAMVRRRRNMLMRLNDSAGVWHEGGEAVEQVVLEYFEGIFWANDVCHPDRVVSKVDRKVTNEMNCQLTRVVTSKEVKRAVFDMPTDKSPGPNGMAVHFFQYFWDIISSDITDVVDNFFHSGKILKAINHTHVFSIPKTLSPMNVSEDVEERKSLRGIRISRESPSISHIVFADDTMIFSRAGRGEAEEVRQILKDYEVVSGQVANIGKCSISFSPRTGGTDRADITTILQMGEVRIKGNTWSFLLKLDAPKEKFLDISQTE
ncbi:hypothetical protein LIER_22447 [Lithospermum erythrorhizon]|uniref:Reverse transcriptase n=1 Tax=Lithospermum erythrorhizon TaxID=34254 RepID=A0AAV3QU48_LITER